jgi:pilus assembly protein CpaC
MAILLVFGATPSVRAEQENDYEDVQILKGDVYEITTRNLQRVSITDPDIADITDAKLDKVSLVAQQPGQAVLFLWDEDGKHSYFVQVLPEDLGIVQARIRSILEKSGIKGIRIERNDLEGKVILSGTVDEDQLETVSSTADTFPGTVLNLVRKSEVKDMVQIDMQVTELSTTLDKAMGIDWSSVGGSSSSSKFSGTVSSSADKKEIHSLGNLFSINNWTRALQINATVNAMLAEGKAKVLSKPRLMVRSGHDATLQVGGEIPIKTTTTNSTTGGTLTENTTFKPYGVSMTITPTIGADGNIEIKFGTEISDIDGAISSTTSKDVAFLTRSANTELLMRDGQTVVLAGLIKKNRSESVSRVPFLSKLPLVGGFFTYKYMPSADKDTEVVISLTSTIVKAGILNEAAEQSMEPDLGPIAALKTNLPLELEPEIRSRNQLPIISLGASRMPVMIPKYLKPYAQEVQQRISSSIAYPYEAKEKHWQGTVKLGLVIRKDGSLRDVFIKEGSGYDAFDKDAVNTARTLAPYNPFPESIAKDEITVTLPIVYNYEAQANNVVKAE